jgi:hypothetical protein
MGLLAKDLAMAPRVILASTILTRWMLTAGLLDELRSRVYHVVYHGVYPVVYHIWFTRLYQKILP